MEDNNKDLELMRKIIEKKKQKSASQTSAKHGREGNPLSNKKIKKSGLSPK